MAAWDDVELKLRKEVGPISDRGREFTVGSHWSTRVGVKFHSGCKNVRTRLHAEEERFVQNGNLSTHNDKEFDVALTDANPDGPVRTRTRWSAECAHHRSLVARANVSTYVASFAAYEAERYDSMGLSVPSCLSDGIACLLHDICAQSDGNSLRSSHT